MVGGKMLFKKASPLDNPSTKLKVRHLSLHRQALLSLLPTNTPHCAVLCALLCLNFWVQLNLWV